MIPVASTIYTQSGVLTTLIMEPFENTEGKGENAGSQHFLLFPQCFLSNPNQISIFESHLFYRLQMLLSFGKAFRCRMVLQGAGINQWYSIITLSWCPWS